MTSAADVAVHMLSELKRVRYLYQETIVWEIETKFGKEFTRMNSEGNTVIGKDVLKAFNSLAPDIVWDRGERMWREREAYDKPGRMQ